MSTRRKSRCGRRYRRWIDQAFVGTLTPRRWRALSKHLRACEPCRDRYDRLGFVDRGMAPAPLSPAALDRLERVVVPGISAPRRRMWAWGGAGALAAAAAAVLLLLSLGDRPGGEFGVRGGNDEPLVPGERQPGVRMFCVVDEQGGPQVIGEARLNEPAVSPEPLRCIMSGELQLAYSTPSLSGLTMVAFSRDSTGRTFWYAPRSADMPALELAPDIVDEPLEWSTRLGVKHAPGTYEVVARFYRGPIDAAAMAEGVARPVYELRGRLIIGEESEVAP